MPKKPRQTGSEEIAELRLRLAGRDGLISRVCSALGITPVDQSPDNRVDALAAWCDTQRKNP